MYLKKVQVKNIIIHQKESKNYYQKYKLSITTNIKTGFQWKIIYLQIDINYSEVKV